MYKNILNKFLSKKRKKTKTSETKNNNTKNHKSQKLLTDEEILKEFDKKRNFLLK